MRRKRGKGDGEYHLWSPRPASPHFLWAKTVGSVEGKPWGYIYRKHHLYGSPIASMHGSKYGAKRKKHRKNYHLLEAPFMSIFLSDFSQETSSLSPSSYTDLKKKITCSNLQSINLSWPWLPPLRAWLRFLKPFKIIIIYNNPLQYISPQPHRFPEAASVKWLLLKVKIFDAFMPSGMTGTEQKEGIMWVCWLFSHSRFPRTLSGLNHSKSEQIQLGTNTYCVTVHQYHKHSYEGKNHSELNMTHHF